MTRNLDSRDATVTSVPPPEPTPTAPRPFWRRPWILPLFVISVAFIVWTARPYLDRGTAPLMPHGSFSLYYPALLGHIAFATVALLLSIGQVWQWLRRTYPVVHRWSGRAYLVTTMIGAGLALVIVPYAPPVGKIGVTITTLLWIAFTTMGYIRIRQRRYAEHRRFMLYSFAIVMNNFLGSVIVNVGTRLPVEVDINYYLEAARWVGWVLNLMIVQWWLYRTADRPVP